MKEEFRAIRKLILTGKIAAAREALAKVRSAGVKKDDEWLVHELYGAIFHAEGDAEGAASAYLNAARADTILRSQREHYSSYLFALHYLPQVTPEQSAREHRGYASLYRDEELLPPRTGVQHDRLRIGFIASDFCDSAAARFYECLLTGLPARGFTVYAYALTSETDEFTADLYAGNLTYRSLMGESIAGAAARIRADEIDILVDLNGHSAGGMTLMIMALRPAPVQLSAIGYFATTGLSAVDGFISDEYLTSPAEERYFTEEVIRLNRAFCFTPSAKMRAARAANIASDALVSGMADADGTRSVIFGSLQNFMKVSDPVLHAWREILARVPASRLSVQDTTRIPARLGAMRERLARAGLPMERIDLRLGADDYLAEYQNIDIMLDTFPYPGGAMTATALYMGVPVIAMRGRAHGERLSSALLLAAGRGEWIADSVAEYVELAVMLATSPRLGSVRENLATAVERSPLMDAATYLDDFERELTALWARKGDFRL